MNISQNGKKLSETMLQEGGLMRCCTNLTLPEYVEKHADEEAFIGTVIECQHCKSRMVLNENYAWRWLQQ